MIRRETCRASASWVLVPQVEHADLARQLAAAWDGDRSPLAWEREKLLPVLQRHDDGWKPWDARVDLDPRTQEPLDFLDRSREEADAISRRSIEGVADLGPLAQWLVADHFVSLRTRRGPAAGGAFVREIGPRADRWRRTGLRREGLGAEAAFRLASQLPFFDALSLWLCGAPSPSPMVLRDWNGVDYHLEWGSGGSPEIWPWPFGGSTCELAVEAFRTPQRCLMSSGLPLRTVGRPEPLQWTFARPTAA